MKKLFVGSGRLAVCLCELMLGILLLINPEGFTKFIIIGAGVLLLVAGAISIVHYLRAEPRQAAREQNMAKGLFLLLLGLVCCFRSQWMIELFKMLTFLYGMVMLLVALVKVQWCLDMKRMQEETWYLTAISAGLTLVFALLIMLNPFGAVEFVWTFLAVTLIAEAVLDAVSVWMARKWLKSLMA